MDVTIDFDPDSADFGRIRPVLKPGVARALTLGRELDMWNTIRLNRASLIPLLDYNRAPAFHAAFLVGLAQIDAQRRSLRLLLADALDEVQL